jgi:hypothetical protein
VSPAILFAVSESSLLLTQLFGLAPTTKLLYASDGLACPSCSGRAPRWAGLARVLDQQVADGVLTPAEAHTAAEQMLFRNAQEIYGLQ